MTQPRVCVQVFPLESPDLFLERRDRPAIETRLDDPEGRVEGGGQRIRAEDVLEVVVPRAVERGRRSAARDHVGRSA